MRRFVALVAFALSWVVFSIGSWAFDLDPTAYSVYEEGLGSGAKNLFIVPKQSLLILHGSPATPIAFTPNLPAYQVTLNSDGTFSSPILVELTARNLEDTGGYTLTEYLIYGGDFSGDGESDLLMQGIGGEPSFVLVDESSSSVPAPRLVTGFGTNLDQNDVAIAITNAGGSQAADIVFTDLATDAEYAYISTGTDFRLASDDQYGIPYSDLFGSINGQLDISPSGAAVYSIPLQVPPGTAGVTPKLSIVYNSQSQGGLFGNGWSLDGLSSITRCPSTIRQDGFVDPVDLDDNDQYCLDGNRLILVNENYQDAEGSGKEYRTELESFSRVVSFGDTSAGPVRFKVWTKSGDVIEYGYTDTAGDDSRIQLPGSPHVLVWAQNKVSDAIGNYYSIAYQNDDANGEFFPIEIRYAGNSNQGVVPRNAIKIYYEERPNPKFGFFLGRSSNMTKRISHIEVSAKDVFFRSFVAVYKGVVSESASEESVFSALRTCDAQMRCLSENIYEWDSHTSAFFELQERHDSYFWGHHNDGRVMDVDGDGRDELVLRGSGSGAGTLHWVPSILNPDYVGDPNQYYSTITLFDNSDSSEDWNNDLSPRYFVMDVNGDGKDDFVGRRKSGELIPYISNGATFDLSATSLTIFKDSDGWNSWHRLFVTDVNGDGRDDLLGRAANGNLIVYLSNGVTFDQSGSTSTEFSDSSGWGEGKRFFLMDINGDGRGDLVGRSNSGVLIPYISNGATFTKGTETQTPFSDGVGWNYDRRYFVMDVNGDGNSDLVARSGSGELIQFVSNGTFFQEGVSTYTTFSDANGWNNDMPSVRSGSRFFVMDLNGDGQSDLLGRHGNGIVYPYISNGRTFDPGVAMQTPFIEGTDNGGLWKWYKDEAFRVLDVDGDGRQDLLGFEVINSSAVGYVLRSNWVDSRKIISFDKGLGTEKHIVYKSLQDPEVYSRAIESSYPVNTLQHSLEVVHQLNQPNGIGGLNTTTYTYSDLRYDRQGLGSLGFASITVTDEQTGTVSATTYNQNYPFIGFPKRSETRLANGDLLKVVYTPDNAFVDKLIDSNGVVTHLPYTSQTVEENYVLNSTTGRTEWVSRVTTDTVYSDNYGNPSEITVTTTDGVENWITQTVNTYENNEPNWILGRLTRSVVTKNAPGVDPVDRISGFAYHPVTGFLTRETIEPDNFALSLSTVYTYDAFGNRQTATRCGGNPALCQEGATGSRTTTTLYDSNGQFPETTINAVGHTETNVYDDRFGVITSHTGPNGIATTWEYDSLGRKYLETRADGNQSTIDRAWCDVFSGCPAGAYYKVVTATDGVSPAVIYFDQFNREIRRETVGFDGDPVYVDIEYDAYGRVKRTSNPYSTGENIYWTTLTYDVLGRVVLEEGPDGNSSTISYEKFAVTATNALGQSKTETKNAAGQLRTITDANGGSVLYGYSADGQLVSTTSRDRFFSEMFTTAITYDELGRKIKMIDPDKGTWFYEYNSFGELSKQYKVVSTPLYAYSLAEALADGAIRMQRVEMSYDALGRLRNRVDYRDNGTEEDTSIWDYDTATNGMGKLSTASSNAKTSQYFYDGFGRSTGQMDIISGGATAAYWISYDSFGRIREQTDAVNFGSGIVNHFNDYGYVEFVTDLDTGEELYRINAMNARGQVTEVKLADQFTTQYDYDERTGQALDIYSFVGNGLVDLQKLTYTWDAIGNMLSRHDQSAPTGTSYNQQQSFCFDELNRLVKAYDGTLPGNCTNLGDTEKDVTYDDFGRIRSKAGVGVYSYGTATYQPHAVQTTTLNNIVKNYVYDNTGNLRSDDNGRQFDYYTFDKPSEMIAADAKVEFWYGADRSRYKRVDTQVSTGQYNTTYYLGNVEKVVKADGSYEMKRYIGGYALWTHKFDSAGNELTISKQYMLKDVLGSTNLIVDDTGSIVDAMAFDAWGQRIYPTSWTFNIQQYYFGLWNINQLLSTSRGFTGHEGVDALGVIHMNGRIYDPKLGRFIQADPIVDGVTDTQGYDRYSYVRNNPLNKVDPTGYSWWSKKKKQINKAFRSVEDEFRRLGKSVEDEVRRLGRSIEGWGPQIRRSLKRFDDSMRDRGYYFSVSTNEDGDVTGCAGDYTGNQGCYTYENYEPAQDARQQTGATTGASTAGTGSRDTGGKSVNGAASGAFAYSQSWMDSSYYSETTWLASNGWMPNAQKAAGERLGDRFVFNKEDALKITKHFFKGLASDLTIDDVTYEGQLLSTDMFEFALDLNGDIELLGSLSKLSHGFGAPSALKIIQRALQGEFKNAFRPLTLDERLDTFNGFLGATNATTRSRFRREFNDVYGESN